MSQPAFDPLITIFEVVDPAPWFDLPLLDVRSQAMETATSYLAIQAERLRGAGLTIETAVRLGHPAEEILVQALARQAELVVMSTHGRSGLPRRALGSVAERVARATPVPVLLLPAQAQATLSRAEPQASPSLYRLLVPLDGSVTAEAALAPAIELAGLLGAEV